MEGAACVADVLVWRLGVWGTLFSSFFSHFNTSFLLSNIWWWESSNLKFHKYFWYMNHKFRIARTLYVRLFITRKSVLLRLCHVNRFGLQSLTIFIRLAVVEITKFFLILCYEFKKILVRASLRLVIFCTCVVFTMWEFLQKSQKDNSFSFRFLALPSSRKLPVWE